MKQNTGGNTGARFSGEHRTYSGQNIKTISCISIQALFDVLKLEVNPAFVHVQLRGSSTIPVPPTGLKRARRGTNKRIAFH